MSASNKGYTIAEILIGKFRGWVGGNEVASHSEKPAKVNLSTSLFNPLKFALGGYVAVDIGYFGKTFEVKLIAEFTRRTGNTTLKFTDYALHDPSGPGDDGLWITIRAIPHDKGNDTDCFILTPRFESGYTDELAAALEGEEIHDDDSGLTYRKVGVYEAKVREIGPDIEGINSLGIKYWDFLREKDGKISLYIVEMDQTDRKGWIQVYLGSPCPTADVRPISGHTSVA